MIHAESQLAGLSLASGALCIALALAVGIRLFHPSALEPRFAGEEDSPRCAPTGRCAPALVFFLVAAMFLAFLLLLPDTCWILWVRLFALAAMAAPVLVHLYTDAQTLPRPGPADEHAGIFRALHGNLPRVRISRAMITVACGLAVDSFVTLNMVLASHNVGQLLNAESAPGALGSTLLWTAIDTAVCVGVVLYFVASAISHGRVSPLSCAMHGIDPPLALASPGKIAEGLLVGAVIASQVITLQYQSLLERIVALGPAPRMVLAAEYARSHSWLEAAVRVDALSTTVYSILAGSLATVVLAGAAVFAFYLTWTAAPADRASALHWLTMRKTHMFPLPSSSACDFFFFAGRTRAALAAVREAMVRFIHAGAGDAGIADVLQFLPTSADRAGAADAILRGGPAVMERLARAATRLQMERLAQGGDPPPWESVHFPGLCAMIVHVMCMSICLDGDTETRSYKFRRMCGTSPSVMRWCCGEPDAGMDAAARNLSVVMQRCCAIIKRTHGTREDDGFDPENRYVLSPGAIARLWMCLPGDARVLDRCESIAFLSDRENDRAVRAVIEERMAMFKTQMDALNECWSWC